jgi:membrane-bound ClpP family serine protease
VENKKITISLRVIARYIVMQIPGFVLFGLVLILCQRWVVIPSQLFAILLILWILKDIFLFPIVWQAYADQEKPEESQLLNALGTAFDRLDPSGYVRVRGELWRAERTPDSLPIEKGESVQVVGRDNLLLKVKKIEPPDQPLPRSEN